MEKLAENHRQYGGSKTKLKTRDFHARVSVLLLRAIIIKKMGWIAIAGLEWGGSLQANRTMKTSCRDQLLDKDFGS